MNQSPQLIPADSEIRKVYFIGIGGIGMSALARYFHNKGAVVSGYDKTRTPLTDELVTAGINIHFEDNIDLIPKDVDVVVYTPAIPKDQAEFTYYKVNNYVIVKRSDILQWITENSFNICIAGTHGKTTITTMTAHVLRDSSYGCNAFLGGIAANYNTNFWSSENNVVVVEADEYDRSFLKLAPNVAVVTAMDADHLDIYGTGEEVENAFIQFTKKLKPNGFLLTKYGLHRSDELSADNHLTYAFDNSDADVFVKNVKVENGSYRYDVISNDWQLNNIVLHMGGLHNIENSIVAITIAKHLQIEDEKIKDAIANFKGVRRRFEYIIKNDEHILIDDYAHHPEELRALITGVRSLFKDKLTIVFQPHLFSRTKDLYKEFGAVLSLADAVILLPIYPARELPMPGVTSELIFHEITIPNKRILSKEIALQVIAQESPKLLVMCGAGDIDTLIIPAKNILLQPHA